MEANGGQFLIDNNGNRVFIPSKTFYDSCREFDYGGESTIFTCVIAGRKYVLKKFRPGREKQFYINKLRKIQIMQRLPNYTGFTNIVCPVKENVNDNLISAYLMEPIFTSLIKKLDQLFPGRDLWSIRFQLLIKVCEIVEWAHKNGIYIGDLNENNFLLDANHNYEPINVDRDNHGIIDPQNGKYYGFDSFPSLVEEAIVKYSPCDLNVHSIYDYLSAVDIELLTLMIMRILTTDMSWNSTLTTEEVCCRLDKLQNTGQILSSEREILEVILSDSVDKPYPIHILKQLNKRDAKLDSFIL